VPDLISQSNDECPLKSLWMHHEPAMVIESRPRSNEVAPDLSSEKTHWLKLRLAIFAWYWTLTNPRFQRHTTQLRQKLRQRSPKLSKEQWNYTECQIYKKSLPKYDGMATLELLPHFRFQVYIHTFANCLQLCNVAHIARKIPGSTKGVWGAPRRPSVELHELDPGILER